MLITLTCGEQMLIWQSRRSYLISNSSLPLWKMFCIEQKRNNYDQIMAFISYSEIQNLKRFYTSKKRLFCSRWTTTINIIYKSHHRKLKFLQALCSLVMKNTLALAVHSYYDVIFLTASLVARWGFLEDHGHHRDVLLHFASLPLRKPPHIYINNKDLAH